MVNPFGEDESESVFAWKERFKQQQFQSQTLQQRVAELKLQLDQLQQSFQNQTQQLELTQTELSQTKQELLLMSNVAKERITTINDLEKTINTSNIVKLREDNAKLTNQLENLQGQLARGNVEPEITAGITTSLTPLMLRENDPDNPRYQNAFVNLVEIIIEEGDTFQKIIGLLIKHGGSGPINNIKGAINSPEFSVAVEMLIEENILKKVDDQIMITTAGDFSAPKEKWAELELSEVFELLKTNMEKQSNDEIFKSLDKFRDTLQEREIPAAKIFFEIRKMSENINHGNLTRNDAIKQIDNWWNRLQSIDQGV